MKFYITKYALTAGVWHCAAEVTGGGQYAHGKAPGGGTFFCRLGSDAHETIEGARARVKAMIAAKRKSLAKSAAALDTAEARAWAKVAP